MDQCIPRVLRGSANLPALAITLHNYAATLLSIPTCAAFRSAPESSGAFSHRAIRQDEEGRKLMQSAARSRVIVSEFDAGGRNRSRPRRHVPRWRLRLEIRSRDTLILHFAFEMLSVFDICIHSRTVELWNPYFSRSCIRWNSSDI